MPWVVFCTFKGAQIDSVNLFFAYVGVYGDVVRVKILFNKKDTALIQFNYVQQAQTGNFDLLWYSNSILNEHYQKIGLFQSYICTNVQL